MDSMVERIAQTLRISLHLASEREREAADRAAVAVLRTMMEPTQVMIEVGASEIYNDPGKLGQVAAATWQAMLTAALSDTEGR